MSTGLRLFWPKVSKAPTGRAGFERRGFRLFGGRSPPCPGSRPGGSLDRRPLPGGRRFVRGRIRADRLGLRGERRRALVRPGDADRYSGLPRCPSAPGRASPASGCPRGRNFRRRAGAGAVESGPRRAGGRDGCGPLLPRGPFRSAGGSGEALFGRKQHDFLARFLRFIHTWFPDHDVVY
jgi:hypothetical protein